MKKTYREVDFATALYEQTHKGAVIAYNTKTSDGWEDPFNNELANWRGESVTGWDKLYKFAIVTEADPKFRPWEPEEVAVGSIVREIGYPLRRGIIIGYSQGHDEVITGNANTKHKAYGAHGFSRAFMLSDYEHSVDGGKTWIPCGLEVEE